MQKQIQSPIKLLLLLILGAVALNSCTPKRNTVTSYKYLISDDNEKEEDASANVNLKAKSAIDEAVTYLGTPYRYGGISKEGIDCSGLTTNAYKVVGVGLPRSAADQSKFGELIPRDKIRPGDLVFFTAKNDGKIDHVGMVVKVEGDQVTFIHSTTKNGVRYDQLNEGYWKNLFRVARRVSDS